jgi:hypothetical protein
MPHGNSRRGFWDALVAELRPLVAEEIARHAERSGVGTKDWVTSLQAWSSLANDVLQPYGVDFTGLPDIFERLGPREAAFLLTSFSLFRLRPYRRKIVWARFSNDLLPAAFVRRFVLNQEADLSSGETAFAAFASGARDYADGLVVGDGVRNLRGTYSVLDRLLGLRNNAFVPLRSRFARSGTEHLTAVVVVSFPVPHIFPVDLPHRIAPICRKYEELFERLLQVEQLDELARLRDRYGTSKYEDAALRPVQHVVPRPLPAAATITLTVDGSARTARPCRARVQIGGEHLSQYFHEQAELSYFLGDSWPQARQRTPLLLPVLRVGALALSGGDGVFEALATEEANAQLVLDAILNAERNSSRLFAPRDFRPERAEQEHLRIELLRTLAQSLVSYLSLGDRPARHALMRYLKVSGIADLTGIGRAIGAMRGAILAAAPAEVQIGIGLTRTRPVPVTTGTAGHLAVFGIGPDDATSDPADGSIRRRAITELGTRHGLISFCRMLTCLATGAQEGMHAFQIRQFGFSGAQGPLFSSLLFPDDALLSLVVRAELLSLSIVWRGDALTSDWRMEAGDMPLAIGMTDMRMREDFPDAPTLTGPWPTRRTLFCDLVRRDASSSMRIDEASVVGDVREQSAVALMGAIDAVVPVLLDSVDSIEIVPLPVATADSVSLDMLMKRTGEQDVLVIGGMKTWAIESTDAVDAVRCGRGDSLDPLSARLAGLADNLQVLEIDRRRRDQFEARLGRLEHELRIDKVEDLLADISTAKPENVLALLEQCAQKLGVLRDLLKQAVPSAVSFDDFVRHLSSGIVDARIRIKDKLGIDLDESIFQCPLAVQASPAVTVDAATELWSNVLANAYLAGHLDGRAVSIEIAASHVAVTNHVGDGSHWDHASAILSRRTEPSRGSGLERIVTLSDRLGLAVEPLTLDGTACVRLRGKRT